MEAKRLDPRHEDVSRDIAERLARIGLDAESKRVEPESSLRILFWQRRYDEIIDRMSNVDIDDADADSLGYLAFALQAVGRDSEAIPILESIGLPNACVATTCADGPICITWQCWLARYAMSEKLGNRTALRPGWINTPPTCFPTMTLTSLHPDGVPIGGRRVRSRCARQTRAGFDGGRGPPPRRRTSRGCPTCPMQVAFGICTTNRVIRRQPKFCKFATM